MDFRPLDPVVLAKDLPQLGLRRGDLGAVVETCGDAGVDVEFVTASGRTVAVVTLPTSAVRAVAEDDLVSVRTRTQRPA